MLCWQSTHRIILRCVREHLAALARPTEQLVEARGVQHLVHKRPQDGLHLRGRRVRRVCWVPIDSRPTVSSNAALCRTLAVPTAVLAEAICFDTNTNTHKLHQASLLACMLAPPCTVFPTLNKNTMWRAMQAEGASV
jgi:hypothetical protein